MNALISTTIEFAGNDGIVDVSVGLTWTTTGVTNVWAGQEKVTDLSELSTQERAEASGLPTRQSGPSLTYLHAEELDGRVPPGVRRGATLEDVFVSLTGEYVE